MKLIRHYWNTLGVQAKLHILIQGVLILLFIASMQWLLDRFEDQLMTAAESRAQETADGLINGMNMLMITGMISNPDNRRLLVNKMSKSDDIAAVRIIRGKPVVDQYGPGLPQEQALDQVDREVLSSGKMQFKREINSDGTPVLRVVMPFIAQTNFRETNCLSCHHVPEGAVNGAASVSIDLSRDVARLEELNRNLWVGNIVLQVLLSVLISWFVRRLIVRNIEQPVKKLQQTMSDIQHEGDLSKRAEVDGSNADIDEMAHSFNRLLDSLQFANQRLDLFGKMFHNSGEAILITDAERNIVAVNAAFVEVTGYSADEAIGQNPRMLSSGKQSTEFYRAMWLTIAATGQWRGEIWNRRKSGEVYPEWLCINVVRDSHGNVINYVSSFSDITQRKEAERRIEFLAHHDMLTGLPNRALFADRLEQSLLSAERNGSQVGLLFLDLDKFKSINDTLGHLAGDQLLQSVAQRLTGCVRETDTVCRQGGDEFLVLLSEVGGRADVERIAEKIIAAMEVAHRVLDSDIVVTFSIGLAVFPEDGTDSATIIHHADAAMYRAKARGRNNYQ